MKILAAFPLLFALWLCQPHLAVGQKLSPSDREKLQQAGKVADLFVERFRQTLDFGTVWSEFHMSDPSCTYKANVSFSEMDYKELRFDNAMIAELYIAFMNYYYLGMAYGLSLARIDSDVSEESLTPRDIKIATKRSRYLQNNDDIKPQNAAELAELIADFNRIARLYRKHMPRNAMKTAAWRANYKYLTSRGDIDHTGVMNGHPTFCVPESSKVYIVDRGIFYFYIVKEKGKMKVAGLGID